MSSILPKTRAGKAHAVRRATDLALYGIDHSLTDHTKVRDHLLELHAMGFSARSIAVGRGLNTEKNVLVLMAGRRDKVRGLVAHEWLQVTPQTIFRLAPPDARVASYAALRRCRALQAIGYELRAIESRAVELTGTRIWLSRLTRDPRIESRADRAMAAVYEELHMTPGPSMIARSKARARGYAPPLAWDDIEQFDEVASVDPVEDEIDEIAVERVLGGEWAALTSDEINETIRRGAKRGLDAGDLSVLLRMSRDAVSKRASRERISTTWNLEKRRAS